MSQASQQIAQQFIDGGVVPADLAGQDAASKTYVDNQLEQRDRSIAAAASAAGTANSSIETHKADSTVHVTSIEKTRWDSKAPGSTQTDLASHTGNSTIHVTAAEHIKLDGIQVGAEVNQNAFSSVNDLSASEKMDAFFIVGGIGIVVTTDPITKKVTITARGDAAPGPHASTHITGGADVIPDAVTGGSSGLMSGSDAQFVRVDGETKSGAQEKVVEAIEIHNTDAYAHGIGDKAILKTNDKTSIVGAINELFTNANSLKSDWAGVIGSPLVSTDTSAQLKNKTQTIKNLLATHLTDKGLTSSGIEELAALVSKVPNINTGKRFMKGSVTTLSSGVATVTTLTFRPKVVIIAMDASNSGFATSVGLYSEEILNRSNIINFCVNFSNDSIKTQAFTMNSNGFTFTSIVASANLFNYIAFE